MRRDDMMKVVVGSDHLIIVMICLRHQELASFWVTYFWE